MELPRKHDLPADILYRTHNTRTRLAALVRARLEPVIPVIQSWPQAMAVAAHPTNAAATLERGARVADDIWHYAGDTSTDVNWYTKRAVVGAVYAATELYMITGKCRH